MGLTEIALLTLISYYVLFIIRTWRFWKFAKNNAMFFVPVLPLLGQTYMVVFFVKGTKTVITVLNALVKHFGLPSNIWLGENYYYMTAKAEEVKILMYHPKSLDKAVFYDMISFIIGESILTVPTEKWKPRRSYLSKGFKPIVIKSYFPAINRQSIVLVENLKNRHKNFNLIHFCDHHVFTTFFLTAAGLNEDYLYPELEKYGELLSRLQDTLASFLYNPLKLNTIWYRYSSEGRKASQILEEARKVLIKIINDKRRCNYSSKEENEDNVIPLLQLMLNEPSLSEKELSQEFFFLAGAATDTTGHSLAFCFTLLAMHPEIQEKAYNEIISLLGEDGELLYTDLSNFKYIEAIILESLRVCPSVPLIAKKAADDINLGDKILPKNANIVISMFHLHRDEKYWKNPLKFDPSRFLPPNASDIYPNAFFPFAGGPRDCLGRGQAMIIMKCALVNVIRKFKLSSCHKSLEDFEFVSTATMKTIHPLDCHFTLR